MSDQCSVEIYALIDPRDGSVRYVGKANDASKRFKSHMRETRRDTPVYRWIAKLRACGLQPGMKVLRVCSSDEWGRVEREEIEKARAISDRMLNVADGGNEPFCAATVRAKSGARVALIRACTPIKARIYKIKQQIGILLKDGCVSDAAKAKLRIAAERRPDLFGQWAAL